MTPAKRLMDLAFCLLLLVPVAPMILAITLLILLRDGRPVFYLSERMKTAEQGFTLVKFRTMTVDPGRGGVTGGDKTDQITRTGRWLRRLRLDELPQIWNVLRGDISLVGPRPPLRRYVEAAPALYREVLACRPGITGLATLRFHRHEALLLAGCRNAEETDRVYRRRCVPRKAQLDLIYRKNRNVCFDFLILVQTFCAVLPRIRPKST
ncbi:sugar transferase [Poseidonocella sp. HB161398]|uniref:sugar transferase n=1 Tax=Poseidonocella sp. HB161398 TaxID=2320855 RepID=UPI001F0F8BF2|nr:sugar transferase [Poseidonocella sp. HB161398]